MERSLAGAPGSHNTRQLVQRGGSFDTSPWRLPRGMALCMCGSPSPSSQRTCWGSRGLGRFSTPFLESPLPARSSLTFPVLSITLPTTTISFEAWWVVVVAILLSSLIELHPPDPLTRAHFSSLLPTAHTVQLQPRTTSLRECAGASPRPLQGALASWRLCL